mmetsp:Transcript_87894/g.253799  ORF Transcript_87894/g.253799 Transcript_87894/m.253799 type:complete len:219 (+) Transcript_87894:2415-3071(+)
MQAFSAERLQRLQAQLLLQPRRLGEHREASAPAARLHVRRDLRLNLGLKLEHKGFPLRVIRRQKLRAASYKVGHRRRQPPGAPRRGERPGGRSGARPHRCLRRLAALGRLPPISQMELLVSWEPAEVRLGRRPLPRRGEATGGGHAPAANRHGSTRCARQRSCRRPRGAHRGRPSRGRVLRRLLDNWRRPRAPSLLRCRPLSLRRARCGPPRRLRAGS